MLSLFYPVFPSIAIHRALFRDKSPLSTALWFYDCQNLKTVRNPENLKTDSVTNMSQMFSRCGGLETLDLRGIDTGNVTNMKQMLKLSTQKLILMFNTQ